MRQNLSFNLGEEIRVRRRIAGMPPFRFKGQTTFIAHTQRMPNQYAKTSEKIAAPKAAEELVIKSMDGPAFGRHDHGN